MMDVDLLRPGTVPISPDTILWFEFLLNPTLLEQHLSKRLPDPSPTDLMIKFMSIHCDQKENDVKIIDLEANDVKLNGKKHSHKGIALKILSLKVASFLKWDLDILEKKLPLPMQITFFQDLFYITGDIAVEIPGVPEFALDTISDQLLFTLVLYHRWHLRAVVNRALNNKQSKMQLIHIPGIQEPTYVAPALIDDIIRKLQIHLPYSVEILNTVLQRKDINPRVLTTNTFQILTEDTLEIRQNWENMQPITLEEFKCQIHYDLATFHLLREEYQIARSHIEQAKDLFAQLSSSADQMLYCRVQKSDLDGYCLATNVPVDGVTLTLTQQLHASIKDQYANILEILQADNIAREIPLVYRDNLELDIQGGVINRKIIVAGDLLLKIQCLNLLRKILDGNVIQSDFRSQLNVTGPRCLDMLFWAIEHILPAASATDKQRISRYLLYLVIMSDLPELPQRLLDNEQYRGLFSAVEIAEIEQKAAVDDVTLPPLLLNNDWGVPLVTYTQSKKFKMFELERRLIASYNPDEIREILLSLDGKNPMHPPWRVQSRWELPIPLQSVINSLTLGFYTDYAYIIMAKSRELMTAKNFKGARILLRALADKAATETSSSASYKLAKLIHWELTLVDLWDYHNSWPSVQDFDVAGLIEQSKSCLGALQATDQVMPRQEIIEYCTIFLLNVAEWDYLCGLEKRSTHCEFAAALSAACQEIVKFKGGKKFPRETWDMLLVAFGPSRDPPQKRSSSGASTSSWKDVLASISGTLSRLREPTALTVAVSVLSRIHNVLRDEASLEVYAQYLSLWPASISNTNSHNIRSISEFLLHLLTQALKSSPTNVSWLRSTGDLHFVLGYYENAMKYYLQAVMVSSDLFSQPVPRPVQAVYWRMIKSCAHLQCYTQATVLCQFLEEVNYTLAFKMASSDQKSCATADAMDAYYYCIWDTTILEYLIHLHAKRGEHHRKQLAVKIIGLLELNSNNNEEIQREAANIRKNRFFRALAKQYVY